jgi:dUTP pyrophosphatase
MKYEEPANVTTLDCKIGLVKTHPDAQLPTQAHSGDNCWDVYAVEDTIIPKSYAQLTNGEHAGYLYDVNVGNAVVPVGLKVAYITPGYGFVFRGRSGLGFKHGIMPHFGEIDNGYRGDLGVKLYNLTNADYHVKKGDKVAQIKIEKNYNSVFYFDEEVANSTRGEGGFGSSGR